MSTKRVYRRTWIAYWVPCYDRLDVPEGIDCADEKAVQEAVQRGDAQWETVFTDFDGIGDAVQGVDEEPDDFFMPFSELPEDMRDHEIDCLGTMGVSEQ